ncbi:unnamed protein product [Prorocentrum cordatum]|uniref:Uncharacterized protein n=1 Tax=Prorocentrum cordatum TaxID=2364126 RepID=A0ABN9U4Q1_9DINO|nr:unnamed protein product [Polarella glacialis]
MPPPGSTWTTTTSSYAARLRSGFTRSRLHTDDEIFELCVAPDPVRQVESDLERLLPAAELAQQMLLDALLGGEPPDGHAEWPTSGNRHQKPAAAPLALGVYNPGAKERGAAERKQLARYAPGEGRGCCWSLLDLARVSLVFPSYRALQSSLDAFLTSGEFDVVLVRNFFRTPSRLGARHVDVYVAFPVPGEGGSDPTLHICEVRFEEQSWMKARLEGAAPHVDSFFDAFRRTLVTLPGVADLELASHLAQDVLTSQPETGMLKHFRRSLARQQLGSSVAIWRDVVPGRRLDFPAFRDISKNICRALGEKKEHMTALWTEMDPGFAGCVSLFDFDAEAAASLKRFRDRVLTLGGGEEEPGAPAAPTGARDRLDAVLRGIHALVQPRARGQLGRFEFQRLAQSLGILAPEAARILACLDRCRMMDQRGQGQVFVRDADIGWLLSLDRLVDLGAACLEDHRRPAGEASGPWDASDSPQQQGWNFSERRSSTRAPSRGAPRRAARGTRSPWSPRARRPRACRASRPRGGRARRPEAAARAAALERGRAASGAGSRAARAPRARHYTPWERSGKWRQRCLLAPQRFSLYKRTLRPPRPLGSGGPPAARGAPLRGGRREWLLCICCAGG